MGEQIIIKGGNNKKSGGSDKKKSGGNKKSGGSDEKKSGGVNETLIDMDMGGGAGDPDEIKKKIREILKKNVGDFIILCNFKLFSYCNNINNNNFTSSIIKNISKIDVNIKNNINDIIDKYLYLDNLNKSNYELINFVDIDFKILSIKSVEQNVEKSFKILFYSEKRSAHYAS